MITAKNKKLLKDNGFKYTLQITEGDVRRWFRQKHDTHISINVVSEFETAYYYRVFKLGGKVAEHEEPYEDYKSAFNNAIIKAIEII